MAGRGSESKSNVMIMAESTIPEDLEIGTIDRQYPYFKAKVLENHKADGTNDTIKNTIEEETSIVFSDKSTSYLNIADYVDMHITEKSSEQTTKETLKWVHIAIENAKRDLQKFYKTKKKYLQLYLNEFIYKLNRRYFGNKIFDRLSRAVVAYPCICLACCLCFGLACLALDMGSLPSRISIGICSVINHK
jgi:transposase-like protein